MTRNQNQQQSGFTVVELLVVFLIMILLSSIVIVNWNRQRPLRNLIIAQNELISNIRKVQSYAVSSRNLPDGGSARFYMLKFIRGQATYDIEAIDSANMLTESPVETVNMPADLSVSFLQLTNSAGIDVQYDCMYLVFSVVYGKTYFFTDNNCSSTDLVDAVKDPVRLAGLGDFDLTMSLQNSKSNDVRSVRVDSQTGRVETYTVTIVKQ